jgi:hypothetical protein
MNEQDVDAYQWVVLPEAERWLAQAALHGSAAPRLIASLRKTLSPAQVHEVLEQSRLRKRARKKFAAAERMFFTEKALQQATDERLAVYKAHGFPDGTLADLCCGIGGDLLALARRHQVVAVDNDPRCATFAAANCRVHGRRQVEIRTADVNQLALDDFAAWHLDPDRRPHGRRTTHTAFSQPSAGEIDRLRELNPNCGIKLAPAANVPPAWEAEAALEWIGIDRECRQLWARFGALTRDAGRRMATILDATGVVARRVVDSPTSPALTPLAAAMGRFLYEPHACVIAAGLVATLADQSGLSAVAPDVAYLTGDVVAAHAALAVFEIDAWLPFDLRKVQAALRQRRWGQLEIKRRGIADRRHELTPEALRKRLRVKGDEAGVLILMPRDAQIVAVLARRR